MIGRPISRVEGTEKVTGAARYTADSRGRPRPEPQPRIAGTPADTESFQTAAELAMAGATPLSQNAFKVDLGKHSVVRALRRASASGSSEIRAN